MPYFLKHYFDPDFDYMRLHPRQREDGSVDHFDLSYVQNVVQGQVLAEMQDLSEEEAAEAESRFVLLEPRFPAGRNTELDPDNSRRMVAACSGYVFYEQGRITVKRILNVRRDVDFHTGNIPYVGDMVVHGAVRSGFRVRAAGLRVKGNIEGASVGAIRSIVCESGVKGGYNAFIDAGDSFRCGFCEGATIRTGANVLVEGACMHSRVFAGGKLAVKGRLTGCEVYCFEYAYVGEQLGGGMNAETSILAGYDPMLLYADRQLNERIAKLHEQIRLCEAHLGKNEAKDQELREARTELRKKLALLQRRKTKLWERIHATGMLERCRIIVPGTVKPGVEISIGPAYRKVDDFMENVRFYYKDREILIASPAIEK
ncbi:hypothetical protein SAMN02745704_00327 [Paucidesulfovibrio gracilis DSM 16080]|uniref:DUF342 domain-containing protein n=1 Tax=Paucidesulfovibrio gracilis DSM 16080 TaxID=1121449 RepID=A0A1T4W5D6_9BACT|nr:FapA family protein [Paucidesulfovibrio gracilis]SKA72255.1 hypothetical protein SAMN02745704_00327 [Paucidesulfovibrio gracilis DSM 16080]